MGSGLLINSPLGLITTIQVGNQYESGGTTAQPRFGAVNERGGGARSLSRRTTNGLRSVQNTDVQP